MHLTVAYMTNRRDCRVQWFIDSFRREFLNHGQGLAIRAVMVDFYAAERQRLYSFDFQVPPKPTVWQGKYRLTSRDYFAASNARNTALCLAPAGYIAFVDDLSVLMPCWLKSVRAAMTEGYIVCGAYKKVTQLQVENGKAVHFIEEPKGIDSRWNIGDDTMSVRIGGGQMFGASVAGPVEAFLDVNGFDEDCDSMGSEDYICGLMLENAGYRLFYDRRMLTLESEEMHHVEKPFLRIIKKQPDDASWNILNRVRDGSRRKGYCSWDAGLADLRLRVLAGEAFPNTGQPVKDWRDGQPISEM